jgi:Putative beta-barrel porin 2
LRTRTELKEAFMKVWRAPWVAVTVAVAAALLARDAEAQGSPILPETRSIQVGPMRLYPTMALREVGTDSNVYVDETGPKGDFTYSVTPRVYVVTPIANTRFIGRAFGNLVYYRTYTDQQSTNMLFDGRYEVVSPGFRPFVSAGFADRRERQGYEIDARARQKQTTALVGADVDLTAITAVTAWASRTSTKWDEDEAFDGVILAEQLNYVSDIIAGGARFKVTPLTRIVASVEIQRDRFDESPLRDADSMRIGPSVDFDSTAAIAGHVTAGYRSFRPVSTGVASFRGFTASTQLRYQFRDWTEVNVDADRDVDYSYDPLEPYVLESGGRIRVTQRLIAHFEVIGVGERRLLQHQRPGETSFDGRREITRSVGGGIGIQFQKQVRFELVYEQTTRTSSEPAGRDYERTRLFGSIGYGL